MEREAYQGSGDEPMTRRQGSKWKPTDDDSWMTDEIRDEGFLHYMELEALLRGALEGLSEADCARTFKLDFDKPHVREVYTHYLDWVTRVPPDVTLDVGNDLPDEDDRYGDIYSEDFDERVKRRVQIETEPGREDGD